jgi:hypothetical protein
MGRMDADEDKVDWEAEERVEWVEGKKGDKDGGKAKET